MQHLFDSRWRRLAWLGVALAVACFVAVARAEERRGRNRPILRLKSDYPLGTVRQLAFLQEREQLTLFSAGDDKVVRRWKVLLGETPSLEPAGQFHWPIYLADRGNIHALAVARHPTAGGLVAVGGMGYSPPMVGLIPVDDPNEMQTLLNVNRIAQQPVRSLSFGFDPTAGDTLLAVAESFHTPTVPADVVVWKVTNPASPELLGRYTTRLRSCDLVSVNPGGSHFVVAGMNAAGGGSSVELWDIRAKSRFSITTIKSRQEESLFRGGIGWTANNAWVCGSLIGPIPSTFPTDAEVFFGGTYAAQRKSGSAAEGVEIRNSTGRELAVDAWEDKNRAKAHRRSIAIAAGRSETLGQGLPGLFVDALVGGRPENQVAYGCAKGVQLEFLPLQNVAAMAVLPGERGELVVGLREASRCRISKQTLGQAPVPLDPADAGFHAPQREPIALAVSPDGRYVAAAGLGRLSDGLPCWQIRLWDYATGRLLIEHPPRDATQLPISGPIEEITVAADDHTMIHFRRGNRWKNMPLAGRILGTGDDAPAPAAKNLLVATRDTPLLDGNKTIAQVPAGASFVAEESRGAFHNVTHQLKNGWVRAEHCVSAAGVMRAVLKPEPPVAPAVNDVVQRVFTAVDNPQNRTPATPHPAALRPKCAARLTWPGGALDLLAVGYDNEILVWNLAANPPKAVRSFYTHESPVTCLGFSVDGRLLVTGAADGTIAGWRADGWQRGNELGVTLSGAAVASVVDRSPGWEAGFARGQTIATVNLDGYNVPLDRWKSIIEQAPPGRRLTVAIQGSPEPLITPVSWDPLWTFAPRYDGDWVLWTPQGQLETKATLRQRLGELPLEWQVGLLRNRVGEASQLPAAPRIFDAGVFLRMNAEQAGAGTSGKTMGQALDTVVNGVSPAADDSPQFPDVDLRIDPGGGTRSPRITQLLVNAPAGDRVERVDLWLNSLRIGRDAVQSVQGGRPLELAPLSALRAGENNVVAVTTVLDAQGSRHFFQDVRRFTLVSATAAGASRTHFLGCGVARVDPELKLPLPALRFPGKDVVDIRDALRQVIPQSRQGSFAVLANEAPADAGAAAPTGKLLLDALAKLAGEAQPEDVAIVMLAGHGDINPKTGLFEYIAEDGPVSADRMQDALGRLRCRTIVFLDTCHSEGVAGADRQLRELSRLLPGPLIITSCGANEKSTEHADLQNGFFTAALKEALTGAPPAALSGLPPLKRSDGPLTVTSLFDFIEQRTPQYLKALSVGNPQTPQRIESLGFADAARFRLD